MAIVVLAVGTILLLLVSLLLIALANRPTKQSNEYLDWIRHDKAIRQAYNSAYKEGNW